MELKAFIDFGSQFDRDRGRLTIIPTKESTVRGRVTSKHAEKL